jgi:hypothetical protein
VREIAADQHGALAGLCAAALVPPTASEAATKFAARR